MEMYERTLIKPKKFLIIEKLLNCFPATTIFCEQNLSVLDSIVNEKRNRLGDEMIEAILMINRNFYRNDSPKLLNDLNL